MNIKSNAYTGYKIFTDEEIKAIKEFLKTPKTGTQLRRFLGIKTDAGFRSFLFQCENNSIPIYEPSLKQYCILTR